MKILVCGGDRSGKSDYAQQLAISIAPELPRYYVATMIPKDSEDHERIRSHLRRREGLNFQTLECGTDLLSCLENADSKGVFLLDSLTALLSDSLFRPEYEYRPSQDLAENCISGVMKFLNSIDNAVIVTDNIFCDAENYSADTEFYIDILGRLSCMTAEYCDTVIDMSSGLPVLLKGELPNEKIL